MNPALLQQLQLALMFLATLESGQSGHVIVPLPILALLMQLLQANAVPGQPNVIQVPTAIFQSLNAALVAEIEKLTGKKIETTLAAAGMTAGAVTQDQAGAGTAHV